MASTNGIDGNHSRASDDGTKLSSVTRVAGITELLEQILVNLPAKELGLARRTSRLFKETIETSSVLRKNLRIPLSPRHSEPHSANVKMSLPFHPLVFEECTSLACPQECALPAADNWRLAFTFDTDCLRKFDLERGKQEWWYDLLTCSDVAKGTMLLVLREEVSDKEWQSPWLSVIPATMPTMLLSRITHDTEKCSFKALENASRARRIRINESSWELRPKGPITLGLLAETAYIHTPKDHNTWFKAHIEFHVTADGAMTDWWTE